VSSRYLSGVRGHLSLLASLTLSTVLRDIHATRFPIATVNHTSTPSGLKPDSIIPLPGDVWCNNSFAYGGGICDGSGTYVNDAEAADGIRKELLCQCSMLGGWFSRLYILYHSQRASQG
jgi:hypothetical protein